MDKDELNGRLSDIFNTFSASKNKISAKEIVFKLIPRELKTPMGQFNAGKPITGVELQKISKNWKSKEPLIDEDGNAFVLFIPDFSSRNGRRDISDSNDLPKYHLSWCTTLEYMSDSGRMKRYIKKTDIESNLFDGKSDNDEDMKRVLYACKNCRNVMNGIHGWENLYFDVEEMDILKFFRKYGKSDMIDPGTSKPYSTMYPRHWSKISKKYREKANWKCEKCGDDFTNKRSYLDVHHKNGVRSDVRNVNLEVLCKKCHSEEPHHGHYKRVIESNISHNFTKNEVVNSISKSQLNKFKSFIENPERYATGSEKAMQKVADVKKIFDMVKKDLSTEKQEKFTKVLALYEHELHK